MTKSQVNRLGEMLRKSAEVDSESLRRLQDFRASYDEPMAGAQVVLRELGFEATSRLKTTNTIIEKLRRDKTRLAEMQDIGGLRIVAEVDLTIQDNIVKKITDAFPVSSVLDRRKRPTHGYRAVHVIATHGEQLLEIQVRTQMQDLWAQTMERLADEVGRDVRYGHAPQRRFDDVSNLLNISNEIAELERIFTKLNQLEKRLPQPSRAASGQRELRWRIAQHVADVRSFREVMHGRDREIRAMLEALTMRQGAPK